MTAEEINQYLKEKDWESLSQEEKEFITDEILRNERTLDITINGAIILKDYNLVYYLMRQKSLTNKWFEKGLKKSDQSIANNQHLS